ncbi:hypothetical protein QYE76_019368 [Lolium multiflorum]|uniref:RNase H type-1 domain-containing protein n=1 Tax=Lolium multiflorum TaxID=4521 RepID=A0AAD8VQC9_LOLMU|nr:hypothetical protein QYE76_019368 [Lolium multiflorum]
MEMTFGKFHFASKEGAYRLEVPISSGLSAVDPDFSNSASSIELGDEEISSPRFIGTKASEKLAKIFNDMSFESSADSYISDDSSDTDSFDFIDKSISIGKVFTNLYDGVTKPSEVQNSKYHQIYAIGETSRNQKETSEAFDELGNPYVDPSDLRREYEALIHGMKMAKACGTTRLKIFGDSQLVAQQVMNQCDAVNDSMVAYKEMYNELEKLFDGCEVNHISRLSNDEADVLANIGSQCLAIPPGVFWEEITERSTKPRKSTKKEKNDKPLGAAKETLEEEDEE